MRALSRCDPEPRTGVVISVDDGAGYVPQLFASLGVEITNVSIPAAVPRRRLPVVHRTDHPRLRADGRRCRASWPRWRGDDGRRGGRRTATRVSPRPAARSRSSCSATLIRTLQDRTRFVAALVQPLLFLFVLGSGLSSLDACVDPGPLNFADVHVSPGILATSDAVHGRSSRRSRSSGTASFGFPARDAPSRRCGAAASSSARASAERPSRRRRACSSSCSQPFGARAAEPRPRGHVVGRGVPAVVHADRARARGGGSDPPGADGDGAHAGPCLLPLSFLSGALYPLSNLPTWLSIAVPAQTR